MNYNCNICNVTCSVTEKEKNYEISNTCSIKCYEIELYKLIIKNVELPENIIFVICTFLLTNNYLTKNIFNLKKYL